MTKAQAAEIKKIINQDRRYTTYYSSKNETLSIRVYRYINNDYDAEMEKTAIQKVLEKVQDQGYKFEIKHRTYQGFIHETDIILS